MKALILVNITSPTRNQRIYKRVSLNDYPICVVSDGSTCDVSSRESVVSFLTSPDVDIVSDVRSCVHVDDMLSDVVLCVNAVSADDGAVFDKSVKYEIRYDELLHEIPIDVQ